MTENNVVRLPEHEDDGGAIGRGLTKIFGRSYRTTIAGIVGVVGQGAFIGWQVSQGHMSMEQAVPLVLSMVTAGGLIIAKDARVSGKSK